jgi:hypothetical protein
MKKQENKKTRSQITKALWQDPEFLEKMKNRKTKPVINDGLNKHQRYKLKNLEKYREQKRNLTKQENHKEKRREYQRKWRAKNREHHNELCRISHNKNSHKHVDKRREDRLKNNYNLTVLEYESILKSQNDCCKICKKHKSKWKRNLSVDHCHKTGKIRGILCTKCNTSLAWFELFNEEAKNYLNSPSPIQTVLNN